MVFLISVCRGQTRFRPVPPGFGRTSYFVRNQILLLRPSHRVLIIIGEDVLQFWSNISCDFISSSIVEYIDNLRTKNQKFTNALPYVRLQWGYTRFSTWDFHNNNSRIHRRNRREVFCLNEIIDHISQGKKVWLRTKYACIAKTWFKLPQNFMNMSRSFIFFYKYMWLRLLEPQVWLLNITVT